MIASPEISTLVATHRDTAERVAKRFADRLPPGATVEDLIAECWSAVWLAADRTGCGRELEGEFAPYAFRAAVNAARRFVRRQWRRGIKGAPQSLRLAVVSESLACDDGPQLADLAEARRDAGDGEFRRPIEWWHTKLTCLPARHRRVVVAHAILGASFSRIARSEGLSKSRAHRVWLTAVAALKANHPELETELRNS